MSATIGTHSCAVWHNYLDGHAEAAVTLSGNQNFSSIMIFFQSIQFISLAYFFIFLPPFLAIFRDFNALTMGIAILLH